MNGIVTNATDWRSRKLQGRCKFQGLPISIENERGSYRQGTDRKGKPWRTFMHIAYGYIRLTEGTDGDHVDAYIGPAEFSDRVFIVHQNDPYTGAYDEDKVMLGFNNAPEAKAAYIRQYDRPDYFGTMDEYDMATFKRMLKERKGMKLKKSLLDERKYDRIYKLRSEPSEFESEDEDEEDIEKALIPVRRMITRGGKTFLTTLYVSSKPKEEREGAEEKAVVAEPKARPRTRSTVPLMQDQRAVLDFAPDSDKAVKKVLAFQREYYKGRERPSMYEIVEAATEEVEYALSRPGDSGKDWYKKSMLKTRAILSTEFPDLAGDTEWDFFLILVSVLSPAMAPGPNLRAAVSAYRQYKETGNIPEINPETGKPYSIASRAQTKRFNAFRAKFPDTDSFVQFINGVSSTGDLNRDYGSQISGKKDETAFNSMVFGEKVGMFYQSLRGTEGAVAVDRWAIRAYYRWSGLLKEGTGTLSGELYNKMSVTDRRAVEYVVQTVGERLGLASSETQAVMWYYEKRLYEKLGMKGITAATIDFADAAEELFLKKSRASSRLLSELSKLFSENRMPTFSQFLEAIFDISFLQNDLEKAKYLARWRGKDGKWHYRYKPLAGPKLSYTQVSAEMFVKTRDTMMPDKYAAFVTSYKPREYKEKGAKLYISPSGQSGYAITSDGDLISVFSKPGAGAGVELMKTAIRNGAKTLDCIGPYLPQFYARFGFREYDRLQWDDQYAPSKWDYEKFGRPDVVMMRLEGQVMKSVTEKNNGTDAFRELSMEFARDFFGDEFVDETLGKAVEFPEMSLIKSDAGQWYLKEHGILTRFWWFHGLDGPDPLAKAKRMPIGTISRGRKKVAEGKWVPVKKERGKGTGKPESIAASLAYASKKTAEHSRKYGDMLDKLPIGTVFKPSTGKHSYSLTDLAGDRIWVRDDNAMGYASTDLLYNFGQSQMDKLIKESKEKPKKGRPSKPVDPWKSIPNPTWEEAGYEGAFLKRAKQKYGPRAGKEFALHRMVKDANRSISSMDYNLSTIEGWQRYNEDLYQAHVSGIPNFPLSKKELIGVWQRGIDKNKLGVDIEEEVSERIAKKWGGLEKAVKTKAYYSPEEVKARGMRWVTIRGARVLIQGTADGGWVVVGGAGGRLNHLRIDRVLTKEEYAAKRKETEKKRKEELRALTREELAEQAAKRREEVRAKRAVRTQYTEQVTKILGVTPDEIRSEISAKQIDELSDKARERVEARARRPKDLEAAVEAQTQKELDRAVQRRVKSIERQALETLMRDYLPGDPNAKSELRKLLDKDKALEILAARKQFRQAVKEIGKGQADIPTTLKVGDVLAGTSKSIDKEIQDEIQQAIETQKNIRLYDTLNAQSLTIQKHIDQGSISAMNGLIGDLYGVGATFSTDTVENLGLEAVVRAVTIKIQQDGMGDKVRKALETYAAQERERVVTEALEESERRFQNADELRALARDTEDAEAILSMASANGHALKQLTAGQRALGSAVGSLRAVAAMINALEDPPADVVQVDVGKDLARARKKAKTAGLPKGSYTIKTTKAGRGKRLVLELKRENIDTFFMRNAEMRNEESVVDQIKMHKANTGYKPPGIKESIILDPAQEAGLRFFKERGKVLLDFEAGLGKTAVGYAAAMEAIKNMGAKKVLIVTPAKLRGQMYDERKTFLEKEEQANVRQANENVSRPERLSRYEKDGIMIIGHDQLRTDSQAIKDAGFDMIIVDEIHEMTAGAGTAGRYRGMMELKDIPLKIGMSGTNIKNKKNELYRKINFIDPEHTLGTVKEFEKRYKGLNQGTGMFSDAANDAFRKEIAGWVYTQKNALPVENKIERFRIPLTPEQRRRYAESERLYRDERERKTPGASARRDARNYSIVTNGKAEDNAKLNRLVQVMKESHEGEKAVIHVQGLDAMRTAKARLEREYGAGTVGIIHGESPPGEVRKVKAAFNDPENPLKFIVGTKSLEAGHNLQGGGTVTFHLDIPDTYAAFDQRNKRIYRKGQDRDTNTYVLSGANPLDMRKEDILETKRREMGIIGNPRDIEGIDSSGFLALLNRQEVERATGQTATA